MARLYRPHVPVRVKVLVALRQTGWSDAGSIASLLSMHKSLSRLLDNVLAELAAKLGCEVSELRLDHDPPLAARPRHRRGLNPKTFYTPDANDPDHLFYRPHGPQHERSHLVKTNIRGDHGQHPDRVLIKKARKLERGPKPKRGPPIRSRGFDKVKRPFQKRSKR